MDQPAKNDKVEDLLPHEWKSDRPKPKEPLFGPGVPSFLAFMFWLFVVALVSHYVTGPMMQR